MLKFLKKGFSTVRPIQNIFTDSKLEFYKQNGFTVLPNVFSKDYIEELKCEISEIINKADEKELNTRFYTGEKTNSEDYFMESGDKVRFFLENNAFDKEGKLINPLRDSINKIGHCLHDLNDKFIRFSYSKEVQYIARKLGYIKPIVPQSMYIFKNARVGGEVPPHTDNAFIRTRPSSCFVKYIFNIRVFGSHLMMLLRRTVVCGEYLVAIEYRQKGSLRLMLMRTVKEGLIMILIFNLNMILMGQFLWKLRREL
jgi:hypothetical protein